METAFEKAKIGEKVWDVLWGWGKIIQTSGLGEWIRVQFDKPDIGCSDYCLTGYRYIVRGPYENRRLFWDEVKIEAPPRPKRKVKKTGWVHLHHIHSDLTGFFPNELVKVEYEIEE